MSTTTTTADWRQTKELTRCGITAVAQLWIDLGYEVYESSEAPGGVRSGFLQTPADIDLMMARQESGHDDWRALAWLRKRLTDKSDEKTTATAMARLAEALTKAGDDWVHGARVMRQQAEIARK